MSEWEVLAVTKLEGDLIIFFSGSEKMTALRRITDLVERGLKVSGLLTTFINFDRNAYKLMKYLHDNYDVKLMLDSGAYSFMMAYWYMTGQMGNSPNKRALDMLKYNRVSWYFERYIRFLKKEIDYFDVYVELDLQHIPQIGMEKVLEWRERFSKEDLEPVLVWHGEKLEEIHKYMVPYSSRLGFPRILPEGWTRAEANELIGMILADFDINWIHLFGVTKWNVVSELHRKGLISSADSTSWLSARMFGWLFYIDGDGSLKTFDYSKRQRDKPEVLDEVRRYRDFLERYREELVEFGIKWDDVYNFRDWDEMNYVNLIAFNWALEKLNREIREKGKRRGKVQSTLFSYI